MNAESAYRWQAATVRKLNDRVSTLEEELLSRNDVVGRTLAVAERMEAMLTTSHGACLAWCATLQQPCQPQSGHVQQAQHFPEECAQEVRVEAPGCSVCGTRVLRAHLSDESTAAPSASAVYEVVDDCSVGVNESIADTEPFVHEFPDEQDCEHFCVATPSNRSDGAAECDDVAMKFPVLDVFLGFADADRVDYSSSPSTRLRTSSEAAGTCGHTIINAVDQSACLSPDAFVPEEAPADAPLQHDFVAESCLPSDAEVAAPLVAPPPPRIVHRAPPVVRGPPPVHWQAAMMDIRAVLRNQPTGSQPMLLSNLGAAYISYWEVPLEIVADFGVSESAFLSRWPEVFELVCLDEMPAVRLR